MDKDRHILITAITLVIGLLFLIPFAYAYKTVLLALALTPYSAGLIGGIVTGSIEPNTDYKKYSPIICFFCWIVIYTAVLAYRSERPGDAIMTGLGISAVWGILPFVLFFSVSCFITERLRTLILWLNKKYSFG